MAEEKASEKKAAAKAEKAPAEEYPDTPSGLALQEVGNVNGEDLDNPQDGAEQGEAYQAAKRKARWG